MVLKRKIAVMGHGGVGKSAIILRFLEDTFLDAYSPTVENVYYKNATLQCRDYVLRITDTAGQQDYSLFPRSCIFDIDGFILVYAIDDRDSFEVLQKIYDKIHNFGHLRIPLILVGNKSDLTLEDRKITKKEGGSLAAQWRVHFQEISAKENKEVTQIIEKLLLEIEISRGNILRPAKTKSGASCTII